MNFEVRATLFFVKRAKHLSKKYHSFKKDLSELIDSLTINPNQGIPLGKDCYKIRMGITSKSKGKSGGARVITNVKIVDNVVFLMDIYDKSEIENITDKHLQGLIDKLPE
ncbi:MAG: type II toxin-antitoxin system RelE/ParE family toxin [Spirosomaceae bacterium]|jgi:mRNA-degrading endonuclease RelE of RelBE toxin-antitoxin system|nr:type II toxin-antitoxin system RelE/ParE family toxin [Spirosomataceae bacterium]